MALTKHNVPKETWEKIQSLASQRKALTIRSFVLPIPPTTNKLFTNVKGVGRVKTKKYRLWRELAEADLFKQGASGTAPVPCRIGIIVFGGRGFNDNRDLDNFTKGILDLLVDQGILTGDSVQHVTNLSLSFLRCDRESNVLVTIQEA